MSRREYKTIKRRMQPAVTLQPKKENGRSTLLHTDTDGSRFKMKKDGPLPLMIQRHLSAG